MFGKMSLFATLNKPIPNLFNFGEWEIDPFKLIHRNEDTQPYAYIIQSALVRIGQFEVID